jgi:hypothetical protein
MGKRKLLTEISRKFVTLLAEAEFCERWVMERMIVWYLSD